ncbi:D-alanyl-D-alanine carboxypeptidase, partial [Corynebacterium bouchesdurhonense]|uniref:D-alanyl-D-alanine carboxypeptidase n=1 Tax=Corynebacterium bouchesdurhonense TaxID=1720192 RepID=UPI000833BEBA
MKVWSWVASAAALVAVGSVAGFGVAAHEQLAALEHAPAFTLTTPAPVLAPATGSPVEGLSLFDALQDKAANPALAEFHAHVVNAQTGEVVFDRLAGEPLRPASTTKVLTAAAALLELGPRDVVTTPVYRGANPGEVVIKASGDVWMGREAVHQLAAQLRDKGITTVSIDTSLWQGMPELLPGWNPLDIDGGYVAPLQPAMLNGGRGLEEESGDVPRSHTPALDVAQALADALGADNAGPGTVPEGAEQLAAVDSPDLTERLRATMKDSDNVFAEAIGREVALRRGTTDAPGAPMEVLAAHGFDTAATSINDNSGLSELNRITPRLLSSVFEVAAAPAEGPDTAALRP